jgi:16S rRNA processing protein RimM
MSEKRILLGEITGAHGIRGDVLVRAYTGDPETIANYGALTDEKGAAPLTLKVLRLTPKGAVVARVKGVTNRNAAEALKGRKLFIARAAMPEPENEDDFYYSDLIGLTAVDVDGNAMGELVAVHNYGAGDLLEIRLVATKKTELIPFTKTVVPKIDLPGRRLTVVMPVTVEGEKKGETTDNASQSDP